MIVSCNSLKDSFRIWIGTWVGGGWRVGRSRLFWLAVLVKARSFSIPSNKHSKGGMSECSRRLERKVPRYKLSFCTGTDRSYSWTAVSRGATLWGVERFQVTSMVEARKARYSYGIITTPPYDPSNQHHEDRFWDPVRAAERAHPIQWLVRKVCNFSPR